MTTLARLKGAGEIVAVATSAVREAANGREFLAQVRALTGIDVRVLSGEDEGALIFRAVRHAVDLSHGAVVLVDVGGGSTEWCVAREGELRSVQSVTLGSLRCARDCSTATPRPRARSSACAREIVRVVAPELKTPAHVDRMIATSGTAACCGDLADLFAEGGSAAAMRPAACASSRRASSDRSSTGCRRHGAQGDRRPAAGRRAALRARSSPAPSCSQELARHADVDRLLLCDRALREGLVLEALGASAPATPDAGDVRRRQVARPRAARARHARRTSSRSRASPCASSTSPRRCTTSARASANGSSTRRLLHDVGYSIHFERHHKHSHYLITTAEPRRLRSARDRGHRRSGALPSRRAAARAPRVFAASKSWQQRTIEKLAAMLRIANALDRTHAARVGRALRFAQEAAEGRDRAAVAVRRRARAGGGPPPRAISSSASSAAGWPSARGSRSARAAADHGVF